MTEAAANTYLDAQAAERARWAAVLAKPATQRKAPRVVRRVSVLARIIALFN